MANEFVWGNALFNSGLVGSSFVVSGYLFKKWMTRTEKDTESVKKELRETAKDIKLSVDTLTLQVRTQNGNVARVTEEIHTQVALCKQRNEDRPKNGRCDDRD